MNDPELVARMFIAGGAIKRLIRTNWRTCDDEPLPDDETLTTAAHFIYWLTRARQSGERLH
jgi:hypothetical protein